MNTSGFADADCASEWLNLRSIVDGESYSVGLVIPLKSVFKRERTRLRESGFAQACFDRSQLDGPLVGFIPYAAMSETSPNRWNLPPFGFTGHRSLATILSHHATTKLSAEIVR